MDDVSTKWFQYIDCYEEYQKNTRPDNYLKSTLNYCNNAAYAVAQNPYVRFAGAAVLIGGGAYVATPLILHIAGFGTAGVAKGALAAKLQATWFGGHICGATGAIFSTFQSVGAAGMALPGKFIFGTAGVMGAKKLNENKDGDE